LKSKPTGELQPLDWNFSTCPREEIPYLFSYEFARECSGVRENVKFIRYGIIEPPTYWSPNPKFGWAEWPRHPYLWVPTLERQKRIRELMLPNPIADVIRVMAEQPIDASVWEQYLAIASQTIPSAPKPGKDAKRRRLGIMTNYECSASIGYVNITAPERLWNCCKKPTIKWLTPTQQTWRESIDRCPDTLPHSVHVLKMQCVTVVGSHRLAAI
jgi:hypothetical protein